jgi:phosphoglycolate phosphatase
VLTNKPAAPTEKILKAFAIRDLFESVIGGDGPYPRKPDPQGLVAMMAATGALPEHTLLVGDSAIDYQTAGRASVRCCLVSYGFGFRAFSRDQVGDGDGVVDDAEGLARWLDSWLTRLYIRLPNESATKNP